MAQLKNTQVNGNLGIEGAINATKEDASHNIRGELNLYQPLISTSDGQFTNLTASQVKTPNIIHPNGEDSSDAILVGNKLTLLKGINIGASIESSDTIVAKFPNLESTIELNANVLNVAGKATLSNELEVSDGCLTTLKGGLNVSSGNTTLGGLSADTTTSNKMSLLIADSNGLLKKTNSDSISYKPSEETLYLKKLNLSNDLSNNTFGIHNNYISFLNQKVDLIEWGTCEEGIYTKSVLYTKNNQSVTIDSDYISIYKDENNYFRFKQNRFPKAKLEVYVKQDVNSTETIFSSDFESEVIVYAEKWTDKSYYADLSNKATIIFKLTPIDILVDKTSTSATKTHLTLNPEIPFLFNDSKLLTYEMPNGIKTYVDSEIGSLRNGLSGILSGSTNGITVNKLTVNTDATITNGLTTKYLNISSEGMLEVDSNGLKWKQGTSNNITVKYENGILKFTVS